MLEDDVRVNLVPTPSCLPARIKFTRILDIAGTCTTSSTKQYYRECYAFCLPAVHSNTIFYPRTLMNQSVPPSNLAAIINMTCFTCTRPLVKQFRRMLKKQTTRWSNAITPSQYSCVMYDLVDQDCWFADEAALIRWAAGRERFLIAIRSGTSSVPCCTA